MLHYVKDSSPWCWKLLPELLEWGDDLCLLVWFMSKSDTLAWGKSCLENNIQSYFSCQQHNPFLPFIVTSKTWTDVRGTPIHLPFHSSILSLLTKCWPENQLVNSAGIMKEFKPTHCTVDDDGRAPVTNYSLLLPVLTFDIHRQSANLGQALQVSL